MSAAGFISTLFSSDVVTYVGIGATTLSVLAGYAAKGLSGKRSDVEITVGDQRLSVAGASQEQLRRVLDAWIQRVGDDRVQALESSTSEQDLSYEILQVTTALTKSAEHLQQIMTRTEQLKETTADLITQAQQAKSLVAIDEVDAARIAAVLGSRSDEAMRAQVDALKSEILRIQTENVDGRRKDQVSSKRSNLLYFFSGLVAAVPVGLLGSWLAYVFGWS